MANYNSLKNAGILVPVANTDLGSPTNTYGNLYMSGNVSLNGTLLNSSNAIAPRVASIAYLGNDTAANPAGGATITLTGSGFVGSSVYIGGTIAGSVSVVSSTQLTFVAPAKTAGSYSLSVVNSDGATATFVPGMQYSGVPAWSTSAGSLGSVNVSGSVNFTVAATSDSTVAYSVTSGSLPSGVSLNSSTGVISGTAPVVGSSTTYNFTIRATDSENQDTDRNFSITVTPAISISLVIAGGGGGASGFSAGGGGGGGGVIQTTTTISPGTAYTVTVGPAGAHNGGGVASTMNGGASSFIGTGVSLTAIGGGGGGAGANGTANAGGAGGSGGGGGYQASLGNGSGGAGTASQGNTGGSAGSNKGGGGGGAGGVGNYYGSFYGGGFEQGVGGDGALTFLGSANGDQIGTGGSAGLQGSMPGTYGHGGTVSGSAPTAGVVAIRYADSIAAASATTGSPTITVAGGYRRYVFTASGSITF
jgi:hypothetical protein